MKFCDFVKDHFTNYAWFCFILQVKKYIFYFLFLKQDPFEVESPNLGHLSLIVSNQKKSFLERLNKF